MSSVDNSSNGVKPKWLDPKVGAGIQAGLSLLSNVSESLDTSMIGREMPDINTISRADVLNSRVHIDPMTSNPLASAASGALSGLSLSPLGAAVGGFTGLVGGIIGNSARQAKARELESQWQNNLAAKNSQFQFQDMRSNLANMAAYGGKFDNQLTEFNTGGTHEENPNGGILQGMGANGKPNLVEQGETKHEDYIYSDRLMITKDMVNAAKLPKSLVNKSFAEASKIINKEIKEKPNDPISKATVKANLSKLMTLQERVKEVTRAQEQVAQADMGLNENILAMGLSDGMYAEGGQIHIKEENVGKFTAAAKRAGKSVQAHAHDVVNNPNSTELQRKRAQFAINAAKWTHAFGGGLFDNPFNNGGDMTHYRNVDMQGTNVYDDGGEMNRYAPVATNAVIGLSDILQSPERTLYQRFNPQLMSGRMSYSPIDTQWMTNNLRSSLAGQREAIVNASAGNRSAAIRGLMGLSKTGTEALGEAYMKASDLNYQRQRAAEEYNLGIEQRNNALINEALMKNLQISMSEAEANAQNRAAKRSASRKALISMAEGLGQIGTEDWKFRTGQSMTGYSFDDEGNIVLSNNKKYKEIK